MTTDSRLPAARARRTAALLVAVVAAALVGTGALLHRRAGAVGVDGRAGAEPRAIAVLPLTAAGDGGAARVARAVASALTARLAAAPELRVAPHAAAAAVAATTADPRAVGRALGVALLLDGAVRRDGARVRVTARLTGARESAVLWRDTFVGDTADAGAVADTIARALAGALRLPSLTAASPGSSPGAGTAPR